MRRTDKTYAMMLLAILKNDCIRLQKDSDWASVVAWTAEDLRQAAGELSIPADLATRLKNEAETAITQVRLVRSRTQAA